MLTQSLQLSTTSHLFKQALRCATRQISRFDKVQSCKEHQQSPARLGPKRHLLLYQSVTKSQLSSPHRDERLRRDVSKVLTYVLKSLPD